jgi:hypothetical protein
MFNPAPEYRVRTYSAGACSDGLGPENDSTESSTICFPNHFAFALGLLCDV